MKAIEFARHGVPHEVCRCIDAGDVGEPGPGEIVVTVDASAINPADLLIVEGRYPGPADLPARVGIEGTGHVESVGDGVTEVATGDRVMILDRANWAERVRIDAAQAIKIPGNLDVLQAAMMKANPPTALLMLQDYVDLQQGDWVIQNAANSAVGYHVIRLARARGLHTINVVRRSNLVEPLTAAGADMVVLEGDDLGKRVRKEIGSAPVRLALDAAGGGACLALADCLSEGGTVVNYGFLSGEPCMITPHHAILHDISLKGFWLVRCLFRSPRERIKKIYADVAQLIAEGVIRAPVEATYDLADVEKALAHAEREGRSGKILFTPNR